MAEYGHARVSDVSQHEDRQLIVLHEQGIADKDIFLDKQSGKNFDRPRYKALLRKLKAGDVVFFCSLDRMGRNYDEMRAQWNIITKEKGADIVVMDMAVLDTRVKGQDLTGRVICDVGGRMRGNFPFGLWPSDNRKTQKQGLCYCQRFFQSHWAHYFAHSRRYSLWCWYARGR
jgi:hypothetical protein